VRRRQRVAFEPIDLVTTGSTREARREGATFRARAPPRCQRPAHAGLDASEAIVQEASSRRRPANCVQPAGSAPSSSRSSTLAPSDPVADDGLPLPLTSTGPNDS